MKKDKFENLTRRNEKKKSFTIYYDTGIMLMKYLTYEQLGKVFEALMMYEIYGVETEFDEPIAAMAYEDTCNKFDAAMVKYERQCERNAENARKKCEDVNESYDD